MRQLSERIAKETGVSKWSIFPSEENIKLIKGIQRTDFEKPGETAWRIGFRRFAEWPLSPCAPLDFSSLLKNYNISRVKMKSAIFLQISYRFEWYPHIHTLFEFISIAYENQHQTLNIKKIDRGQIKFREYSITLLQPDNDLHDSSFNINVFQVSCWQWPSWTRVSISVYFSFLLTITFMTRVSISMYFRFPVDNDLHDSSFNISVFQFPVDNDLHDSSFNINVFQVSCWQWPSWLEFQYQCISVSCWQWPSWLEFQYQLYNIPFW